MSICDRSTISSKVSGKRLLIEPFSYERDLQQMCVDLHVGAWAYEMEVDESPAFNSINSTKEQKFKKIKMAHIGTTLKPGKVYLIETKETITNRSNALLITLNQNMSRLGLLYNSSVVDVGYSGKLILAITVTIPIKLSCNLPFARMQVFDAGMAVKKYYTGHFANGKIPNKSFLSEEFAENKEEKK
jgi:deoxycytidine triphosphate deaminase